MSSRFFATGDTSSETESDEVVSSDDEQQRPGVPAPAAPGRPSRFLASDSDSDDVRRVVRSAKDRRSDALLETAQKMRNHIRNNDWASVQADFDTLNKQLEKIMVKDVVTGLLPPLPQLYLACQAMLEESFERADTEGRPKLSKTNAKAYNTMKQRIRKNAKLYEVQIAKYRQNGGTGDIEAIAKAAEDDSDGDRGRTRALDDSDSTLDSDSDSESDSDSHKASSEDLSDSDDDGARRAGKASRDADGGELSSDWSTDTDDDDDDSDFEESRPAGKASGVSRWLKKDDKDDDKATKKREKREKRVRIRAGGDDDDDDGHHHIEEDLETLRRREQEMLDTKAREMPLKEVDERMQELLASRGKKGTSRKGQIEKIQFLVRASKSNRQRCEVLLHLISALFDFTPSQLLCMSAEGWKAALDNVTQVLDIVEANHPRLLFSDESDVIVTISAEKTMDKPPEIPGQPTAPETDDKDGNQPSAEEIAAQGALEDSQESRIRGDLSGLLEKLDDELYKAWQNMDAYSAAYVERLRDEIPLMLLLSRGLKYYETIVKDLPRAARVASRLILHLYYKSADINAKLRDLYARDPSSPSCELPKIRSLQELSVLVYRYGDERAKNQTIMCHIYNLALSDRFYEARDMLLMSHLQESIVGMDIPLQVLFNRTMAQVGLCAFRMGKIFDAHACLQELYPATFSGGMRTKELLAQGFAQHRGYEKTEAQEKAERRRQVPYHMHLNLDLCETAHLVSAMLLEVPNLALNQLSGMKRRVISKTFQYYLRSSLKQSFPGPPENTRDHVMAASRELMKGNWQRCFDFVSQMRVWKSMTGEQSSRILETLKQLIKVEALRTYVVSYSSFYDAMGLTKLAEQFQMSTSKVHSIISKMIVNEEFRASWDQPTRTVAVQRAEPTRLQALALEMAQKCTFLVEQNEKLMDAKVGGSKDGGDRDDWGDRRNRGGGKGPRDRLGRVDYGRGDRRTYGK